MNHFLRRRAARLIGALLFGCACMSAALCCAEEFPYTAYANAENVYVRSGPGDNYYPTSKLELGEEVEVYRHDPGGWYAIRPPQQSFSWVSAEFLQAKDSNWAEVVGERVVARVGSDFNDARDVIQVHLERGEEVEILEARRFGNGAGAQTWYKISPPAGEFRWVYGRFLDLERRESPAVSTERRQNLLIDRLPTTEEEAAASNGSAPLDKNTAPDSEDIPRESVGDEARDGDVEEGTEAQGLARLDREALEASLHAQPQQGEWSDAEFQDELAAIDLGLSAVLAREPTDWTFESLRERAENALGHARSPLERGRARLLAKKIAQFDDLARRTRVIARGQGDTQTRTGRRGSEEADDRSARRDDQYDGVGKLTPVYSRRFGAPRYALIDATGRVQSYVTPAPGVNLRHYVGQRVGVSGMRGYSSELATQHLTAQRVTILDDGRSLH